MAIDLTGGLDPEFEYFLAERPENPEMRDSATLWVMDDSGDIATQFQIRSVPSILFFRGGEEVGRVMGLSPKDKLRKKIEEILGGDGSS